MVYVESSGTGWFIYEDGTIVTSNHVVEGSDEMTVTVMDGRKFSARVTARDPEVDIALIKIDAGIVPPLKIGDDSALEVGDWVLVIGNPLGNGISAKPGIISRLGVKVPYSDGVNYRNMIETSAPINSGNSGGPLLNMEGEVIGIISVKVADVGVEGMGYAINITDALPVIRRLSSK